MELNVVVACKTFGTSLLSYYFFFSDLLFFSLKKEQTILATVLPFLTHY